MQEISIEIFQKLAGIFNTTVEFVQNNAMDYILKYGKYHAIKSIPSNIALGVMVVFLLGLIGVAIYFGLFESYTDDALLNKKIRTIITICAVAILICATFSNLFLYWASPEMYSFEQVMKLIK